MATGSFYQFQGNPDDEAAWQAFVAANSESTGDEQAQGSSQSTVLRALYELLLIVALIVAFVGTVLWQRNTGKIAALENEVQALEKQLADAATAAANLASMNDTSHTIAANQSYVRQVLDTQFFHVVAETETISTVDAIILELDAAYGQLRADLGLANSPASEKVKILLVNDRPDYTVGSLAALGVMVVDWASYESASQATLDEFTKVVYNDLHSKVAHRLLRDALMTRRISSVWNAVITHLYSNLEQSQPSVGIEALPAHKVQQRQTAQLLSSNTALLPQSPEDWMYPNDMLVHAAADSLVEYILVTYGRESVPRLLDAMSKANDWRTVAPTAFGIPIEQFEAEWQAYLYEHYPTDADYIHAD